MLLLNIANVANLRGISNVFTYLRKLGISHNVAWRYASGEALSISFRHIQLICTALNCTPNDIIQWVPEANAVNVETHALSPLIRSKESETFKRLLKTMPLEKLNDIARSLSEEEMEGLG